MDQSFIEKEKVMNSHHTEQYVVIYQNWDESERGWGVRPDGCSLHYSQEDLRCFIRGYWDSMPDEIPDEYSRPVENPYRAIVSKELYDKLLNSKNPHGCRVFQHEMRGEQICRASPSEPLTERKE